MKKTLKIFEIRKEIVNKLKDEAKADIIKFLLENPFNTIDFTSNTTARGKYHREKIGNSNRRDLTNEELKDLYFSKEYNGNFFDEIIFDKIFKREIYVKASKDSDFGNYYKNKYMILTNFLDNIFEVKTLENMSYYESYERFLRTLSLEEVFEKIKEKKCNIYYETKIYFKKRNERWYQRIRKLYKDYGETIKFFDTIMSLTKFGEMRYEKIILDYELLLTEVKSF